MTKIFCICAIVLHFGPILKKFWSTCD